MLPLREVGCPTVITVHDLAIYRKREWFPAGQPLSTGWIVPRSMRNADRLIAVSQNTASDLQAIFDVPASRIAVVHEGVSKMFRPMGSEDLNEARARLKLPERFILFVSTIEPRKNLETLLEAWAMMRDRPYNLALMLAHPAWYEGFGLPPLEAMACGTPVVVSDASSLPEVVGDAGLLVPADSPEAWRQALEAVAGDADLAADLRRRGILRAAEFSWGRSADLTWKVVDELVKTVSG